MSKSIFNYDEISDTLYISFFQQGSYNSEGATGIELNDNILLRINKQGHYAVSLSIFNYSILAQRTEIGLRSLPLSGLDELSSGLRQLVLEILFQAPVRDILAVSAYMASPLEYLPIATMQDTALLTPA